MKLSQLIFKSVKILIIIISLSYIIFKLHSEWVKGVLYINLSNFGFIEVLSLLLVLFFVVVNWGLESIKFKLLINPFQKISLYKSFQAVLSGITVSIFTPKRIGEFGGRIFVLETNNRLNGIFATLLGNFSQLLITLTIGAVFFPLFLSINDDASKAINYNHLLIPIFGALVFLLLVSYFNISRLGIILGRVEFFKRHSNFILFLQQYKPYELFVFIAISFFRYIIFTSQFIILMNLSGAEISYFNAIIGISQVYFFMTIIPTFALGELGVRGSVSVWVFSIFTTYSAGILMASILLWVLNLAIPAIIGVYFLSKLKY